jgi:hypothetical protein
VLTLWEVEVRGAERGGECVGMSPTFIHQALSDEGPSQLLIEMLTCCDYEVWTARCGDGVPRGKGGWMEERVGLA